MPFPNNSTCLRRKLQDRIAVAPMRFANAPLRRRLMASIHCIAIFATLLVSGLTSAQEVSLLVQRSTLAGFRYYAAPRIAAGLPKGAILQLVREADNPHDASAVRVDWQGLKLGYVPRAKNAALAWAMDQGETVVGQVVKADSVRRSARRLEFDILIR